MVNKIRRLAATAVIVAFFCFSLSSYATVPADTLTTWHYSTTITLNTSPTGANISTTQKNFPVLIRLTSLNAAAVFATALSNGGDLRFSHVGDTGQLAYELSKYYPATQTAFIWVKADSVQGNNANQQIRMWWGKSSATTTSSPAAVFATANGFDAVWHLNSSTGTTSNYTFNDATSNAFNLTGSGTTGTVDSPGVIDSGRAFNTITPSGKDSLWYNGWVGSPANVTMSAWVKMDSIDYGGGTALKSSTIISIGNCVGDEFYENGTTENDSLQTAWNTGATSWSKLISPNNQGNLKHHWVYFVAIDAPGGAGQALYLNGTLFASSANASAINYATSNYRSAYTELGWSTGANQSKGCFFGTMCEARIDTGARPGDWIKLCFENQQANDSLTSITVLSASGIPALSLPPNGASAQPLSLTLSWGGALGASTYEVQLSTSSVFSSTVLDNAGLTATSQAAAGLTPGTTYYWRANGKTASNVVSAWSGAWSFTTAAIAGTPALSLPSNGAGGVAPSLSFSWGTASAATSYTLQISTSSGFGTTVLSQSVPGASAAVSNLTLGVKYYWHVAGVNVIGPGPWSVAWNFTITTTGVLENGNPMMMKSDFGVKGDALVYSVALPGAVEITFSDLLGRVALVVNRTQAAGNYTMSLRDLSLASGRYIVRLRSGGIQKETVALIAR